MGDKIRKVYVVYNYFEDSDEGGIPFQYCHVDSVHWRWANANDRQREIMEFVQNLNDDSSEAERKYYSKYKCTMVQQANIY